MKNPYHFKKTFKLSGTKEAFLLKLTETTLIDNLSYFKYDNNYSFFGVISKDRFEIQSVPSTRTRKLFNPLIIGKLNKDELSIELKPMSFDYIFIALYFILCVLFGIITYTHSLENKTLLPFVFILPILIFSAITLVLSFFAKINYSDALYNIEHLINKSS